MVISPEFLKICKECKAFCCNLVIPPVTEQEKKEILKAGFEDFFIKIGNDIFEMNKDKNKTCPYLNEDYSCKIQHVKPMLCKIWPVIPRNKNNKRVYIVIKCPVYQYLSKDELNQAKKEAEKIPDNVINRLWNISEKTKNKYKKFEYEEI